MRLIISYQQAKRNIIEKGQQLTSGIDPTLLKDYSIIGTYHLEILVRTGVKKEEQFREWAKAMIFDNDEKVKPYLKTIWNDIKETKFEVPETVTSTVTESSQVKETKDNPYKQWLENQSDVTLIKKKTVGVAFTEKTDNGYIVVYSDYTPGINFAKEVGRILSHQLTSEQLKDFCKEAEALGIREGNLKDRFANSVKVLATNPHLIKISPNISRYLRSKDVVIGRVGESFKSSWGEILAQESKLKKILLLVLVIIITFIFTNPSNSDFNHFLKAQDNKIEGGRLTNFFLFSIYGFEYRKTEVKYIGVLGNFIKISETK